MLFASPAVAQMLLLGASLPAPLPLPLRASPSARGGAAAMQIPTAGYMIRTLKATQSVGLLAAWEKASKDLRAAGFRGPEDQAIGERALKLKQLNEELPRLKSTAMILGLCENGQLSFETLTEPHKSQAETLSRTTLEGAISVGRGSAIAFVSRWDDHITIDAITINPT